MVVSPNYRRRGIALSLIKTALHHAKNRGVISVVLSTTMLHSAAVAMYEKFGWVLQKKIGLWIVLDRVWVVFYSLDLTTVNV
jgi:ribosomal protein S18 acetylase RimI-like enzyme